MARQKTVLDASVVIKWFITEPQSEAAEKILLEHISGKRMLYAPDLLLYEVSNTLHYQKLSQKEIHNALSEIISSQIHIENASISLLSKSVEFAKQYGLTVYDGSYAALADILGASLLTADKKLAELPFAEILTE